MDWSKRLSEIRPKDNAPSAETIRNLDGQRYLRLRKLGNFTPPYSPARMRDSILAKRNAEIAEIEARQPDFRELYDKQYLELE